MLKKDSGKIKFYVKFYVSNLKYLKYLKQKLIIAKVVLNVFRNILEVVLAS